MTSSELPGLALSQIDTRGLRSAMMRWVVGCMCTYSLHGLTSKPANHLTSPHPVGREISGRFGITTTMSTDWARPDDLARSRLVQPGHRALVEAALIRKGLQVEPDTRKVLTDYLTRQIEAGLVRNREDILTSLGEVGEITRAGKNYISVKPEGFDKAVRLKGAIYEIDYNADTGPVSEVTSQERTIGGGNRERAGEAYKAFQDAIGKRAEFNKKRYPAKPGNRCRSSTRLW